MKISKELPANAVVSELGKRIQKYRLDMNMKQAELAAKSGVSIATIRRIEAGEDISFLRVVALLQTMGLSSNLDYLLPEEIVNPVQMSKMGHSRKRAFDKKEAVKPIKWGE